MTVNEIAMQWWRWTGPMLWQVSLLIALISLIDLIIRRWAWPQVRYGLWLLVLLKLMMPPTWSSPVSLISQARPRFHETVKKTLNLQQVHQNKENASSGFSSAMPEARMKADLTSAPGTAVTKAEAPGSLEQLPVKPAWQNIALLIWLGGILIFSCLLLLKMSLLRRWHDQQDEKAIPSWFHEMLVETASYFRLSTLPAIVFHKQARTPAVYGLFKPVILLPAGYFKHLSKKEARHVLLHELAHLKRGDLWLHGLCLFLQIIYWYNPLLIWVRRQMKTVREICCDLTVANVLREGTMEYRQTLLNTARDMLTENLSPGLGLLGVFEDPFRLVTRLRWLEKNTWKQRKLMLMTALLISLTVTAAVIPMAAVQNTDRPPSQETVSFKISPDGKLELNRQKSGTEPDSLLLNIQLKKTEPLDAVVLPMSGEPTPQFESAVNRLNDLLEHQNIKRMGPLFGRFFSDPEKVLPENSMWEVGVPVKAGTRAEAPLKYIQINAMQVASATVEGFRETDWVWNRFVEQIQSEGMIPCFPHAYEFYIYPSKDKPSWWRTELQIQAYRPGEGYPGLDISYKTTEPLTAVILPVTGDYYQHPEVLEQLKQYLKKKGIKPAGPPFGQYYTPETETAREDLYWEVGFPVKGDVQIESPYEIQEIASRQVASTRFQGPFNMEHPWSPFITQMILEGYLPSNPGTEIWHMEPADPYTELQIGAIQNKALNAGLVDWAEEIVSKIEEAAETGSTTGHTIRKGPYTIEEIPSRWLVLYPLKGSYDQAPVVYDKLKEYLNSRDAKILGPPILRQYNSEDIVPKQELVWEAAYQIADSMAIEAPYEVIKTPVHDIIRFKISEGHDNKLWAREISAFMLHYNYRPVAPHHIFWTHELFKPGSPPPPFTVEIEVRPVDPPYQPVDLQTRFESDARKVLLLPVRGPHNEAAALKQLNAYIKKNKIEAKGSPFIRYLDNEEIVPEAEMRWQAGVVLENKDLEIQPPYQSEWLSGGLICFTSIKSDSLEVPETNWLAFVLNFTINGYTASGYPWKTIGQTGKKYEMELCFPVRN
jgi:beta-lactamase regulating signal transducer with metallopeptidase domain/effector-binding domain-containing protein